MNRPDGATSGTFNPARCFYLLNVTEREGIITNTPLSLCHFSKPFSSESRNTHADQPNASFLISCLNAASDATTHSLGESLMNTFSSMVSTFVFRLFRTDF